ncbi:NAD-dependent epimerase/dehydratase family protein [Bacillus salipaludis]|uniref:NAD(P)-dependent oxidoreductase n=1 Tax=Bacillus salipaludis TaxID=2547811 RepID=A0AA90QS31_9BACI|nr:NAD(P)-dependent oxidoreductase [Bacillus salipaludis]MDQ6598585.1 NAD(P)-dependent oxidoreductase [Bacillus salipaludis]
MKNKKTIIVTGATGFIGSHLTNQLVSAGWNTHIIIRPNSNTSLLKDVLTKVTIHVHDGTTENLIEIMSKTKPDVVIHLASLFLANHSPHDIDPMIKSNILYSTQLVEAMVKSNIYHLINTGTSWQHFNNQPYNPVCLYAATKEAFNAILTYYTEVTSLNVTTLKLFDTYGPNDSRSKLISLLQKTMKEEKQLAMSNGEQLIDLVYIDDVVNAYMVTIDRHLDGICAKKEEFAISSNNPMSLREIVKIYEKVIGKSLPIEWGKRPYRIREVMVPWNQGIILPNWYPKFDLETGIKKIAFEH